MEKQRCYHCGYVGEAVSFLGYQSTGNFCWTEFRCPQCSITEPPVAPATRHPGDPPAPFSEPKWWVQERNGGLYIGHSTAHGDEFSAPMRKDHHLAQAPASILHPDLVGSIWDHHKALTRRGEHRSRAFKETCEKLCTERADPEEILRRIDAAREEFCLGPYDNGERWDGPTLERRAAQR